MTTIKKTFLGIDITPRKHLWDEIETLREAYHHSVEENCKLSETNVKLNGKVRDLEEKVASRDASLREEVDRREKALLSLADMKDKCNELHSQLSGEQLAHAQRVKEIEKLQQTIKSNEDTLLKRQLKIQEMESGAEYLRGEIRNYEMLLAESQKEKDCLAEFVKQQEIKLNEFLAPKCCDAPAECESVDEFDPANPVLNQCSSSAEETEKSCEECCDGATCDNCDRNAVERAETMWEAPDTEEETSFETHTDIDVETESYTPPVQTPYRKKNRKKKR